MPLVPMTPNLFRVARDPFTAATEPSPAAINGPWIPVSARRRLDRERTALALQSCDTCRNGCTHRFGDSNGCAHYGCIVADAVIADTCPSAHAAIVAAS